MKWHREAAGKYYAERDGVRVAGDSRAAAYVAKHGESSWEVDALPPEVLQRLITERLASLVDHDLMNAVKNREEDDKAELRRAVSKIMEKR